MGEILDVRSLGPLEAKNLVVEEAIPCFELGVDGVQAFELGGQGSEFLGEPIS